jgi:hypothetical protein
MSSAATLPARPTTAQILASIPTAELEGLAARDIFHGRGATSKAAWELVARGADFIYNVALECSAMADELQQDGVRIAKLSTPWGRFEGMAA